MTALPSFAELATSFRAGSSTPAELLQATAARIAEQRSSRAVIALDIAEATRAAEASAARWRQGAPLSPIDGVPILVKANFAVAGLPWHAGIAAYADRIAPADAPCVAWLRAAGAVILGLANMDEAALGATGDNPWLGRIDNPRRAGFSAGGSSGGSAAAVAAGQAVAALGSDTIGSIALPASYCGIVGHRASRALMPVDGLVPLSPGFDHAGWHVRTLADALTFAAVLGMPARTAAPIRLAMLDPASVPPILADAYGATVERARRAGLSGETIRFPASSEALPRLLFQVAEADAAVIHALALRDRQDGFSPAFARMLGWGAGKGAAARAGSLLAIRDAAASVLSVLGDHDALLMPTTPHPAFDMAGPVPDDQACFTALPAALGWPATTFPIGDTADGLPLSATVTAPDDATCLAVATRLAT